MRSLISLSNRYGFSILKMCPKAIYSVLIGRGIFRFHVNLSCLIPFLNFLKKHTLTQYDILSDVVASD